MLLTHAATPPNLFPLRTVYNPPMSFVLAALLSIASPAGPGAAEPHLTTTRGGALLMSWLEPVGDGKEHALKFAAYRNGRWSAPRVIAQRPDFFVNWADFPSIIEDDRGTLFAHWLQKSGSKTYWYDVYVTSSRDDGRTWRKPRVLHSDGKQAEHGFVSMAPLPKGGVAAVWLDGREMTGGHDHGGGPMTLRYAEINAALNVTNEALLDPRVCECCTTGMAMTARGPLVAYRDRSLGEIRDIGTIRKDDRRWTAPLRVFADQWKIPGCPVNGPQVDARGTDAVVAWFAAPENRERVSVAFSGDAGASFGRPIRVDGGNPLGRVDVLLLDDNSALVTWVEGTDDAAIVARRVHRDGRLDAPMRIAGTSSARGSGFPRTAIVGNDVWFAWTDTTAKTIRVARLPL